MTEKNRDARAPRLRATFVHFVDDTVDMDIDIDMAFDRETFADIQAKLDAALPHSFFADANEISEQEPKKLVPREQPRAEAPHRILQQASSSVPSIGTFILALLSPPETRESLLGCIEEQYALNIGRFGEHRARYILWRDLASSVARLGAAAAMKLVGAGVLLDKLRRWL